jgi:hypothetical protein
MVNRPLASPVVEARRPLRQTRMQDSTRATCETPCPPISGLPKQGLGACGRPSRGARTLCLPCRRQGYSRREAESVPAVDAAELMLFILL